MRMWMVEPGLLCDKHLLGEHVECHMFAGTLVRRRSIDGFIVKRLLEPASLKRRHDALAREMAERGFRHESPLDDPDLGYLSPSALACVVDRESAAGDLAARCSACRERASR